MNASTAVDMETFEPNTAKFALTVNGRVWHLDLDPRTSLLDALREHLHLTGTKKGCDHGQCGACTVLINGRRINSCLTLAVMHEDDVASRRISLTDAEIRERMSGNICRCAAYPNIIAAIRDVAEGGRR